MPRKQHGLVVSAYATDIEVDVLLEMMRAGGHATLESVVRVALWNYARHLLDDVPITVFKA